MGGLWNFENSPGGMSHPDTVAWLQDIELAGTSWHPIRVAPGVPR